ncbi:serine acetyltransferase [Porphyromonadaceae bacterium OttesenSCG-928-L07]|nr:serine acetyltransferase [Porphyromonadaceae bacterium OttesenSCG-928-L07]
MNDTVNIISQTTDILSQSIEEENSLFLPQNELNLPDINQLKEIVELAKSVFFPGFFSQSSMHRSLQKNYIGTSLEQIYSKLCKEIHLGMAFFNAHLNDDIHKTANELALAFVRQMPEIRRLLYTDVKAVFDGDPAAKSYSEVIFSYPGIQAMINYRIAHELMHLGIPVIPRIITEMAHSVTGIDIHPGAQIGEYFSMDHGTGIVIGETCIIGSHVRLYQGVTLGAKSFTLDEKGLPMNVPRHPILEDHVIVYSNSTILGRVTIGHDSIIGGNVWQTNSVPPFSRILQHKTVAANYIDGLGI